MPVAPILYNLAMQQAARTGHSTTFLVIACLTTLGWFALLFWMLTWKDPPRQVTTWEDFKKRIRKV